MQVPCYYCFMKKKSSRTCNMISPWANLHINRVTFDPQMKISVLQNVYIPEFDHLSSVGTWHQK